MSNMRAFGGLAFLLLVCTACSSGPPTAEKSACEQITFNLDLQSYSTGPSGFSSNPSAFRDHLKAVVAMFPSKSLGAVGITANDIAIHGDAPVTSGGTTQSKSEVLYSLCQEIISPSSKSP